MAQMYQWTVKYSRAYYIILLSINIRGDRVSYAMARYTITPGMIVLSGFKEGLRRTRQD